MTTEEFALAVTDNLPYEANGQQLALIAALARFCAPGSAENGVFLINGYAGTGKTSVTAALVKTLRQLGLKSVLLAPTGRAAKVFSRFADAPAYTIHRKIYSPPTLSNPAGSLSTNPHRSTIFVVDEASMIGGDNEAAQRNLLEDLIEYVYTGDDCRLILLGDTAQLPPVGSVISPAMDVARLKAMGLRVTRVVMTRTVRQQESSGILYNATRLRKAMQLPQLPPPTLRVSDFPDVEVVDPLELQDLLESLYAAEDGIDRTLIVTRSNKRAVGFNLAIRGKVLEKEEELSVGERVLIAKNNYLWSNPVPNLPFIANGDVACIEKIYGTENLGFHRFADVRLSFPDRDGVELDAKLSLGSLTAETPALPPLSVQEITDMRLRASGAQTKTEVGKLLKTDPYINALQVKYAYTVTCHKAQGGQWENVLVDMGYIPQEALTTIDLYRWLYTAITRATSKVYLINPSVNII